VTEIDRQVPEGELTRRVVVAGGGVAGWMAAAALARSLGSRASVLVIDEGGDDLSLGGLSDFEASLPSIRRFNARLGLDEAELFSSRGAGFGLGIVFTGWHRADRSYMQPFGEVGAPIGAIAFHQLAGRARAEGATIRLADYSLAALCAQAGRFARPSTDGRSPLSSYDYGLHLRLTDYAAALKRAAERFGARSKPARVDGLDRRPDGAIAALRLSDGERIEGDLFLDCTGSEARLLSEVSPAFVDWRAWLPCDRAISGSARDDRIPPLYVHAEAHGAGWRRSIPLDGFRSETLFYASDSLSDERAHEACRSALEPSEGPLRRSAVRTGHRREIWSGNCIGLGASAAVLDPIESPTLHLLQNALTRLISLFPAAARPPVEAAEYNRLTVSELERARDLAILHYKANAREGETLWDRCRALEVPESLAWKIELYRSRGRVPLYDEEVYDETAWIMAFDEQGLRPRRYDPLANGIEPSRIEAHFRRLREAIIGAARDVPPYGDYLRRQRAA
jgi:tryptophan halogenase